MMRFFLSLLSAMMLVSTTAAADHGVRIGLKGGVNFSEVDRSTPPEETTYGQRTGYGAGMELDVLASPAVCFALDLLYLQKGVEARATYVEGSDIEGREIYIDTNTRLDYLVFAPMIRFTAARGGFAPYVQFGGEVGYLLEASDSSESYRDGSEDRLTYEGDAGARYHEFDFGVCFGGGFEIPAGSYALFFEGRYSLGLSDIGEPAEGSTTTIEQKNRGIYVFGGLRF
ncbi:MAG: outer membrane beta-barrel protein [Candidatus Eisenbacteria bacterium]|nr:outer membrane beta-barrel protein [Candidatus Eisenbacteria bacterium]